MCLEISIFRYHTWGTRPSRNSSKSLTTHTGFPPQHITRIYLMKWETRQNSAKHDNKWQSRNSHNKPACSQLSNCTDSSKDYTMLRKAAEVPVSDTETTETSYKLSYLFTHKPTLAISRDPKLKRYDDGRELSKKIGKISAISWDLSFSHSRNFCWIFHGRKRSS